MARWTFVTNHAVVLSFLSRHPRITAHELAREIGMSERAVRRIISELDQAGYLTKEKEGRRVRYAVSHQSSLRYKIHKNKTVGELLKVLGPAKKPKK